MTEAGRQSVPLAEAMALTGHRSVQTALRYFQTGSVQQSRAGQFGKQGLNLVVPRVPAFVLPKRESDRPQRSRIL
jgi:hypothetical protein